MSCSVWQTDFNVKASGLSENPHSVCISYNFSASKADRSIEVIKINKYWYLFEKKKKNEQLQKPSRTGYVTSGLHGSISSGLIMQDGSEEKKEKGKKGTGLKDGFISSMRARVCILSLVPHRNIFHRGFIDRRAPHLLTGRRILYLVTADLFSTTKWGLNAANVHVFVPFSAVPHEWHFQMRLLYRLAPLSSKGMRATKASRPT